MNLSTNSFCTMERTILHEIVHGLGGKVFENLLHRSFLYGRRGSKTPNLKLLLLWFAGFHTHTRLDRDSHVDINWDNIFPDYKHNFELCDKRSFWNCDTWGFSYECDSVMHYAKDQFSINGEDTISKSFFRAHPCSNTEQLSLKF